jgi:hypothetical protein
MRNFLLLVFVLIVTSACNSNYAPERRDIIFLNKRDFIISDTSVKVKSAFISLPTGAVHPQGWIKDWETVVSPHIDEWSVKYKMAWKGIGFIKAKGSRPQNWNRLAIGAMFLLARRSCPTGIHIQRQHIDTIRLYEIQNKNVFYC